MVFLSACNTGEGFLEKGESVQSLANAFLNAGSKSVIMTLWKIPDETTPQIVGYFYRYLKHGMTKSEALRQAKLTYLKNQKDPQKRHPYFWAGFVLIGEDGPVDVGTTSSRLWYVLGIFLTIVFALILIRINTSRN